MVAKVDILQAVSDIESASYPELVVPPVVETGPAPPAPVVVEAGFTEPFLLGTITPLLTPQATGLTKASAVVEAGFIPLPAETPQEIGFTPALVVVEAGFIPLPAETPAKANGETTIKPIKTKIRSKKIGLIASTTTLLLLNVLIYPFTTPIGLSLATSCQMLLGVPISTN